MEQKKNDKDVLIVRDEPPECRQGGRRGFNG